jgi:hypothetical protein
MGNMQSCKEAAARAWCGWPSTDRNGSVDYLAPAKLTAWNELKTAPAQRPC